MSKKLLSRLLVVLLLVLVNASAVWAADWPENGRAYSIDELFTQDLGPDDCPDRPEGRHYWDGRITVIPSLTAEGEYTYTCTACGKEVKLRMQPAISEYQIAAWQRSYPQAAVAEEIPAETNGDKLHQGSGCYSISKLSQGQIRQLLAGGLTDEVRSRIAGLPAAGQTDYEYLAWPSSGNFPLDIFGSDDLWSLTLNPEIFQTPDVHAVHINITRSMDGEKWHFNGDNYLLRDSGKYFGIAPEENAENCLLFRPDGIKQYLGSYTVAVSGLQYLDGSRASITYEVEFFALGDFEVANETLDETESPPAELPEDSPADTPFDDVRNSDYFAQPVAWAVSSGVTNGASDTMFEPETSCNKAQIITFLWRAYGSPQSGIPNPFRDLQKSDYYYDAALWAAEKGIVGGNRFDGETLCTRAMAVNYMWLAAGSPTPASAISFADVPATTAYNLAVAWAVEQNITTGAGGDSFEPQQICTRGQIVTFLYRGLAQK